MGTKFLLFINGAIFLIFFLGRWKWAIFSETIVTKESQYLKKWNWCIWPSRDIIQKVLRSTRGAVIFYYFFVVNFCHFA
jgi:hypothetical protein